MTTPLSVYNCRTIMVILIHDDYAFLESTIDNISALSPIFAFFSRIPWHDTPGDWQSSAAEAERLGATVVLGDWSSELDHRIAAYTHLQELGYTHALIPDCDEVMEPELLKHLLTVAENDLADRVYVEWDTYWISPEYVVRPRERFTPCMMIKLGVAVPVGGRNFEGGRQLFLSQEYGIVHHLSYVGPDERIQRKIATWGHAKEVRPNWYSHVWEGWKDHRMMRNLHPTHPEAYSFVERIAVPEILKPAMQKLVSLDASLGSSRPAIIPTGALKQFRKVSVVIPVHGGSADLRQCLDSLKICAPKLKKSVQMELEVVVVDNGSPDDCVAVSKSYKFVTVIQNEDNRGFAAACNQGAVAATGDVIVFLNSDTVVPFCGLVRLIESLGSGGTIGAAGPFTNYAGHGQQITPTYTTLETLNLFAEDFALRDEGSFPDVERDMLVGFCLAVRRSVYQEVGGFDERFGLGTFEDNDLCYRIRRAGYRLLLSQRSFVHHHGSRTLSRIKDDVQALLRKNERLYRDKWREDIETGFVNVLSGLAAEPIKFEQSKHPDILHKQICDLARKADISLCMIMKNEERVIGDCLKSAKPFFKEIILVDTGSTDCSVEIAKEHGVRLYHFPWNESFADARNVSLKHATGKWIFWMDADDTLPTSTGMAVLQAAINAPKQISGFVVPVQFVDDESGNSGGVAGTRVDHVKLVRNRKGICFEGRIHEQIIPSMRELFAPNDDIGRIDQVVLHSGYDNSPEGQDRKKARDRRILALDIADRPDHPFVLFNLGMTDHFHSCHESAVEWFDKCLAAAVSNESIVRKVYALQSLSYRYLGKEDKAIETLRNGLEFDPKDPEINYLLARILADSDDPEKLQEAKRLYEVTLAADISNHFSSIDMGLLSYKTHHHLAEVLLKLGDYASAKSNLLSAINAAPTYFPAVQVLFDAALDSADYATASEMLDHAMRYTGPSELWVTMRMDYARNVGGDVNVLQTLRISVDSYPQSTAARVQLMRELLAVDKEDEAFPHMVYLGKQNVSEAAYCAGIYHLQQGNFEQAHKWMEHAHNLNPSHEETLRQLTILRTNFQELAVN